MKTKNENEKMKMEDRGRSPSVSLPPLSGHNSNDSEPVGAVISNGGAAGAAGLPNKKDLLKKRTEYNKQIRENLYKVIKSHEKIEVEDMYAADIVKPRRQRKIKEAEDVKLPRLNNSGYTPIDNTVNSFLSSRNTNSLQDFHKTNGDANGHHKAIAASLAHLPAAKDQSNKHSKIPVLKPARNTQEQAFVKPNANPPATNGNAAAINEDDLNAKTDKFSFSKQIRSNENFEKLFYYIFKNEIGKDNVFLGPFGHRQVVYSDYTTSARPLTFIEDYIRNDVLPLYGGSHHTFNITNLQTTIFRTEARNMIRNSCGANKSDSVIFTGSSSMNAIRKMIYALDIKLPPIVFVAHYEHHANTLPWREINAEVVTIEETPNGKLDLFDLERKLKLYDVDSNLDRLKVGCFSAASNITGILADVDKISKLMHRYKGLIFLDYSTAGPYIDINMNPKFDNFEKPESACKDALYFPGHNFIGGPQTPGVLIIKNHLFKNITPNYCVTGSLAKARMNELYNQIESKDDEAPEIVESIRIALLFHLKQACGTKNIMSRSNRYAIKAFEFLKTVENLQLLGSKQSLRLPIFSFLIEHKLTGYHLHHNFVAAILNDLFGVQVRSGCSCAFNYLQTYLSKDYLDANAQQVKRCLNVNNANATNPAYQLKKYIQVPGYTSFSLTFFMPEEVVDYILGAIKFVSENGWKFIPMYDFDADTGDWKHKATPHFKIRKHLSNISYDSGEMRCQKDSKEHTDLPSNFQECLKTATIILRDIEKSIKADVKRKMTQDDLDLKVMQSLNDVDKKPQGNNKRMYTRDDLDIKYSDKSMKTAWFLLPDEANKILHSVLTRNIKDQVINVKKSTKLAQLQSSPPSQQPPPVMARSNGRNNTKTLTSANDTQSVIEVVEV